MSQIELVFGYTKKIEALLQKDFKAEGRGLHTKLNSIEYQLPDALIKKIRWIATIRNNLAHTEGFSIENITDFTASCDSVVAELEALAKQGMRLPGKSSENARLALQKIERRHETPRQRPREDVFSKRQRTRSSNRLGRRLVFPLILAFTTFAWYAYSYQPNFFLKLNGFMDSIVKPKASIQWSRSDTPPQHMEGVKSGSARPSRRIKPATE